MTLDNTVISNKKYTLKVYTSFTLPALELFKSSKYRDKQVVEQLLLYIQAIREARNINNQPKTHRDKLNSVRHVDSVNGRRMVLKLHHAIKRDCRTFGMRERTGFAGPKRVTAVEVPL